MANLYKVTRLMEKIKRWVWYSKCKLYFFTQCLIPLELNYIIFLSAWVVLLVKVGYRHFQCSKSSCILKWDMFQFQFHLIHVWQYSFALLCHNVTDNKTCMCEWPLSLLVGCIGCCYPHGAYPKWTPLLAGTSLFLKMCIFMQAAQDEETLKCLKKYIKL